MSSKYGSTSHVPVTGDMRNPPPTFREAESAPLLERLEANPHGGSASNKMGQVTEAGSSGQTSSTAPSSMTLFGYQVTNTLLINMVLLVIGLAAVLTIVVLATTTQDFTTTDDNSNTPSVNVDTSGLSFTLYRDGYDPISHFTETPSEFYKYAILDDVDAVIEPGGDMHIQLYSTNQPNSVSSYDYKYTVCPSTGGNSNSCQHGMRLSDGSKQAVNFACTPHDKYTISVSEYNKQGTLIGYYSGSALCIYVRREIRTLNEADLAATMDAMYVMWSTSEMEGQKKYGSNYHSASWFVSAHEFNSAQQDSDHMHEGIGFLPQHIKLTNMFEDSLHAINPAVALPYWDYTIDRAASTSTFDAYVFQESMFGTLKGPTEYYWGWTYSNDSLEDAKIQDGRWKGILVDKNTKYPDLKNSYGTVRGLWTLNPSPYVSRFVSHSPVLPACSSYYSWLELTDLGSFFYRANNDPHASTHGAIAAVYGCDVMSEMTKGGYLKDDDAQVDLCSQWGFLLKDLYRNNYITFKEGCSAKAPYGRNDIDCGFVCNDDQYDDMPDYLESIFNSEWTSDGMHSSGWKAWRDFICSGDAYLVFFGDHLDPSVSPSDPSFWVIHPTQERLMHAKYMAGGFDDETWPSDPKNDYVCSLASCYEADYGDTDYYTECCYGHYEFDQLLDFVNGNKSAGYGPTTHDLLKSTKPTSTDYNVVYIYDAFDWSHCDEDFDGLMSSFIAGTAKPKADTKILTARSSGSSKSDSVDSSLGRRKKKARRNLLEAEGR